MDRRLYPDFGDRWDHVLFREEILKRLEKTHNLLDLGAGTGNVKELNFRGRVAKVCGVDPDPRVTSNPFLDEAIVGSGSTIPYPAASFDVVISSSVLEHLESPETVFREVARVLKSGGTFLVKTPNKWHYVPVVARLTPHRFHIIVNRLRGRREGETFLTYYRANTPTRIRHLARLAGLEVESLSLVEGRPEYLRISVLTYLAGWIYERLVNASGLLSPFRVVILAVMRKPGE
jgi:SAM-dependent methyltransferase